MIADATGRAVTFALAPGQAHEPPLAPGLLARPPDAPGRMVDDRGHAGHAFRDPVRGRGARPAAPPKRNVERVACPLRGHENRDRIERLWARLKEWRAATARYEETAASFMGVPCRPAAGMDRLRSQQASTAG